MNVKNSKLIFSSLIILLIVIFDQVTKVLVLRVGISHACNTGFAFGLLQGVFNFWISLLVLLVVIYSFTKETTFASWVGLTLIVGGGASNVVERLSRGCVVDFIDLKIWPAFNLADAAITIGTVLLIFSIIFEMKAYQKH